MKLENLSISNGLRCVAPKAGPKAVIFGGVHGDEPSGVHAIQKLIYDFVSGKLQLLNGSLTLVIANEEALSQGLRYIQHNLNRIFSDELPNNGSTYELRRALELMPILQDADFFLDLHSICTETEPYAVCELPNVDLTQQMGVSNIAIGWAECCRNKMLGDTDNYANKYGALALTYEAGSHYSYYSIKNATATALQFLITLKMIECQPLLPPAKSKLFRITHVKLKEHDSFIYTKTFRNFDTVFEGQIIAFENGQPILAASDGYITLKNLPERTRIGDDIFFLAKAI